MRHVIRKAVIGQVLEIEITEEEWEDLRAARNILTNAFAIEEKYEIVVSNFLDLEREVVGLAVTDSVRSAVDYGNFFEARSTLNVRVVNLLTATRLYLDQLPHHVGICLPTAKDDIRSFCSEQYDNNFEYRFMEALRNFVQHRGTPIHLVRIGGGWTSLGEDGLMEFAVDIAAQRDYLAEDEKFKKAVLDEVASDSVDLKICARKYMECISVVHQRARELVGDLASDARSTISAAHDRYSEVHDGSLVGLSAMAFEDTKMADSFPLLLDWDDIRLELQLRNKELKNFSRRYATGKSRLDRKRGTSGADRA